MLSQEQLKEVIDYDPETGLFLWTARKSGRVIGGIAGCRFKISGKEYLTVSINGKRLLLHRLVFLYMTGSFPKNDVDHIDGNGTNNRWANLRDVTRLENSRNRRLSSDNKSGISGVMIFQNKWYVRIGLKGGKVELGYFHDFFEACCARKSAEIKYGYHPNHGSIRPL